MRALPWPIPRPATVEMHEHGNQCNVCGVTVTIESEMRDHLVGRKHQRKLLQREAARISEAAASVVVRAGISYTVYASS